ncbi:hypothetical protein D3C76_813090 [compost metagenome]
MTVTGNRRLQPDAQALASIKAESQRQGSAVSVVTVQAQGILAQHRQRLLAQDVFRPFRLPSHREGVVTTQVVTDLADQQGVLPGRAGQRCYPGNGEQPPGDDARTVQESALSLHGKQRQQGIGERHGYALPWLSLPGVKQCNLVAQPLLP